VCKAKHKIGKRKKGARGAKAKGKKCQKSKNLFFSFLGGLRVSNVNSLLRRIPPAPFHIDASASLLLRESRMPVQRGVDG
jgi:hypothetical protein